MSEPSWGMMFLQAEAGKHASGLIRLCVKLRFSLAASQANTSTCLAPDALAFASTKEEEAGFRPCLTCDASYTWRAPTAPTYGRRALLCDLVSLLSSPETTQARS